ncbi:zinc-dependent metalloprotease [Marinicella meishanensis]|uniref:zinc-dependent metalloprotease n=1 Tax=Marinicella meishanensis TaxID=2873263 RepID=UPI001CC13E9A|nr:zinc-dependent metalloprotease [Marinicella sp. NBU2979]
MSRLFLLICLFGLSNPSTAADPELPSIDQFTAQMTLHEGFVDFYWADSSGKIFLKLEQFEVDLLYVYYLQSGVGSNDLALDRGQIGDQALVHFKRLGNQVLLVEPNQTFRANTNNASERQAVTDGFAQSVLWGGQVVAQSGEAVLVDWTDFLLRDSQGVSNRLEQLKQGQFAVDPKRSAIYPDNTKNFQNNTEFEALLTFQGSKPGAHIRSVSPRNDVFSIRTHHSLVALPAIPHTPRPYDARSGGIPLTFYDYAAPLGEPMTQQWAIRHRLEKQNPEAAVSDPVEPIVYYLDSGTPEPVRSALLDGARWWAPAFEAAGFSNAFEVKLLPPDADPLDIRYNTIQWVHRSTRGWSYGASVVDPRSGEILKGHVTLGSLRVRQDMLIAQSLLSPYDGVKDAAAMEQAVQDMALARLRQLSAHEVGHTLGLIHNFSASANDRASVMDYPHPLIKITASGDLSLTDAYDVGIGAWDQVSLRYLYQEFADEATALPQLLQDARRQGLDFIADRDARAPGGSHPNAHLWDNGADATQGLLDVLAVRQKALQQFGLNTIKTGEYVANLEKHLVPVYLFHRYQTEAAVKLIAGVDYRYAVKGEGQVAATMVPTAQQLAALDAVLQTIDVKHLALPEDLLTLMLPPVAGSRRDREHFQHRTGLNFDALGVAETAAKHSLGLLLQVERANRLVEHHARQAEQPSLEAVLNTIWDHTWDRSHKNEYHQAVQLGINWVALTAIMNLARDPQAAPLTRATVLSFLERKKKVLKRFRRNEGFGLMSINAVNFLLQNPGLEQPASPQPMPPGSPIGMLTH